MYVDEHEGLQGSFGIPSPSIYGKHWNGVFSVSHGTSIFGGSKLTSLLVSGVGSYPPYGFSVRHSSRTSSSYNYVGESLLYWTVSVTHLLGQ